MAKGYKIKRYSNIYRRHPRRRFTRAIRVILVVAVPSVVSTLMSGAMMGILDGFYWIVNWFVV